MVKLRQEKRCGADQYGNERVAKQGALRHREQTATNGSTVNVAKYGEACRSADVRRC
jgi:hypothetical protein